MNEFIRQQLNKVRVAKLPEFTSDTTHMFIPKTNVSEEADVKMGCYYIIELADYIVKPPENFTLHVNWNNGYIPKYKFMRVTVQAELGKMVKIKGFACNMTDLSDIDYQWEGWVPKKSISIIKEI